MSTSLRCRAATITLAVATAAAATVVAAAPASASDPCAHYYSAYQNDRAKAAAYYAQYQHSTGATRQKAYDEYQQWEAKAHSDLTLYDRCLAS